MKNNKRSRVFIVAVVAVLVACMSVAAVAITLNAPSSVHKPVEGHPAGNPEDNEDYVHVTTDDDGLTHIDIDIPTDVNTKTRLGLVRVLGDYMYVYGYYYAPSNPKSAPDSNVPKVNGEKLFISDEQALKFGWKRQTADQGWGCVTVSRSKTFYADPAGVLEDMPVTWMTNAYNGCTNLTTTQDNYWMIPNVPATAKHTEGIFANCTSLKRVCVSTVHNLDKNAFANCKNLWQVFVGQNVKTINSAAFTGIANNAIFALDGGTPSGYASGWNNNKPMINDFDVSIWTLNNIISIGSSSEPPVLEFIQ
jgi:hypothetical protein